MPDDFSNLNPHFENKLTATQQTDPLIKVPLSKKILFEHVEFGSIVTADYQDDAVKFTIIPPTMDLLENKTVDENGIIVV